MGRIHLEADGTAVATYGPVPGGEYVLRVVKVETGTTRETNRDKSNLTLEVDDGQYKGRKLWHTITWIPKGEKGHGFTVAALKAFGLSHDGVVEFDDDDLLNRTFRAELGVEDYPAKDGSTKMKNVVVRFILPGEEGQDTPSLVAKKPKKTVGDEKVPF